MMLSVLVSGVLLSSVHSSVDRTPPIEELVANSFLLQKIEPADPKTSPHYRSSDWNAQHEKYRDEWQSIMHQLFLMAHLIRKQFDPRFNLPDDHVPQMISKVSTLILHSYPCPMTTTHQREINGFYILVMENYSWFHHQTLSQKQLLNLVELMMEQNVNLRINLNHTFWIRFFSIFHKLPIQYSATQLEHRFNALEMSDAELDHINQLVVSQEPLAWSPRSDLQSRFGEYLQSQDLGGISKLMLSRGDITFHGLTIRTFNALLYCFNLIGDYRNEITHLTMMITGIMPQYRLTANVDTYLVLRSLCKEFPDIANDIRSIPQPNPAHPPIGVIIERLTQIHRIKKGYLYCTVAHFFERDADLPPEPDPLSLPDESSIWHQKVKDWIDSLSESERTCFRNVVRQSQLVENLECRLEEGHCPSIFAWNRFFQRFYELPNEYQDEYILELLHTMEDSSCNASSMTFAIIFQGIDRNEGIQCKQDLKDLIVNDSVYDIPSQIELMESLNQKLERNTQGEEEKVMELSDWMLIFEKFYDSRPGRDHRIWKHIFGRF